MLRHCLYCGTSLSRQGLIDDLRPGVRIAYDPVRGRMWTVCDACHGWSLWPLEDRLEALDQLERAARTHARLLYQTDNVALLEAHGRELIRVSRTQLPEEAWWRYGRELRDRRAHYRSRLSTIGAASYAAVSYVGTGLGLSRITGDFRQEDDLYDSVVRWRRFGRTAWSGRAPCPQCQSVLLKLFFFKSRFLILLPGAGERLAIGMPCARCDPWTVEKIHRFEGAAAESILRRVLAYRNMEGASREDLNEAVRVIEDAGSAEGVIRELAAQRASLFRLQRTHALALEICVNEGAERRQLARETANLEANWMRAEELAAVIDEELE